MDLQTAFWALGDPQRFRMIQALRESPCFVSDLVARLGTAQPNVSRHLKVLKDCGLISSRREGKWIRYAIVPGALEAIRLWVGKGGEPASAKATTEAEGKRREDRDEGFLFTS